MANSCRAARPLPLSVVIPVLNAAAALPRTLAAVTADSAEIILIDGGSRDGTLALGAAAGGRVIQTERGRGVQLAAGVALARQPWLLLLHADTRLTDGWADAVRTHVAAEPGLAGYFRFGLASPDPRARRLERLVAWRCRLFALPYGDQGLLIHRDLLAAVGGLRPWPLMEDVDLVRRLGRHRLVPLAAATITSAEKWVRDGWLRRSLRNLLCLSLYFVGVPPRKLVTLYG